MDELYKQNVGEETAAEQPGGENTQPVPPADTGAQEAQQPAGESTAAPETQLGKLICPRCGNAFEPKEKKCPHCGMKNNLKLCKTCGATIAKNAKRCPKCGAKNKKPIYKRVWFWVLAAIVLLIIMPDSLTTSSLPENAILGTWEASYSLDLDGNNAASMKDLGIEWSMEFRKDHTGTIESSVNGTSEFEWSYSLESAEGDKIYNVDGVTFAILGKHSDLSAYEGDLILTKDRTVVVFKRASSQRRDKAAQTTKSTSSVQKTETSTANVSAGKKNALEQAYSYLNAMAFSYSGLIEQLEYEGYSTEDATYAADNCGADWLEQAAKKAEEYLDSMPFSELGLIEQLEYEGFTNEQATYGAHTAFKKEL